MFKMIGAVLTLLSSSALGFCFCEELVQKQGTLQKLMEMMEYISGRILVECDSLSDAFRHTAERVEEPYAAFLHQVSDRMGGEEGITLSRIWQEEAQHLEPVIGREETEELSKCMGQTGFSDKTQQSGCLRQYCEYLRKKTEEIERTKAEKCKVYKAIGIMAGALCVIILW
ncbi:MAG: stage III sporulation protein AB [Lachnospiraceae bacterium]|nr:stage III sporulation protein AB [Lachnospiraceae bacterium]